MDSEALLWEHITPMITRDRTQEGVRFPGGPTTFPRDCITIRRCRPFTFSHKVANKWFDRRRILIGDSAHIFPPFGGEGMTSGIRDAHQLAWRLALVQKSPGMSESAVDRLLAAWEAERRRGIDDAANFTKINGTLANEPKSWGFFFFRHLQSISERLPFLPAWSNLRTRKEASGFIGVNGGFFLPRLGGGGKLAQVLIKSKEQKAHRSDELLRHNNSMLTLLVIGRDVATKVKEANAVFQKTSGWLPPSVLSEESIVALSEDADEKPTKGTADAGRVRVFYTTKPGKDDFDNVPNGYQERAYLDRLGASAMYAILRPDFYVFAILKSTIELERALGKLQVMLYGEGLESRL